MSNKGVVHAIFSLNCRREEVYEITQMPSLIQILRCQNPGVTPPPVDPKECTEEQINDIKSNKKCGIFLDPAGPLKACLDAVSTGRAQRERGRERETDRQREEIKK